MEFLPRSVSSARDERKSEARLVLIFALLVRIAGATDFFSFQEHNLRNPFARVNLRGKWRCVADFNRNSSPPFGFEWCNIYYDTATGVSAFPDTDAQNISWNFNVFHRFRECEAVRRDDAEVAFDIHERFWVEVFGIDRAAPDVREHFETPIDAHVVAVTRDPIRDHARTMLARSEWHYLHVPLDHPVR